MRKLFILLFLALSLISCSGRYEKAISDYVQTDDGTKYDLRFKSLAVKELKKVTVADSIAYLNDLLEYFRRKEISFNEMLLQTSKEALARWESRGLHSQIVTDNYKSEVAKYEHILDSVKNTTPDWARRYDGRKENDVLAVLVECRYSMVPPIIKTKIEETKTFVLTPDGKKCFGALKKK